MTIIPHLRMESKGQNKSKTKKHMIYPYKGPFNYNKITIGGWNNHSIGIYYCGYLSPNRSQLMVLYIGKGTGEGGIRIRLLDHLREEHWPDVTHFGYHVCDSEAEAEQFEGKEIDRCKPKYNQQGK